MKVRWTAGSLRLRITPSELGILERGEPLEERLRIPGTPLGSGWVMLLLPGGTVSEISAQESVVLFDISREDIKRLLDSGTEGIYCQQKGSPTEETGFSFYVEKDFPCVHPRPSELEQTPTETFVPPIDFNDRKL